jgi:hypothetical protein
MIPKAIALIATSRVLGTTSTAALAVGKRTAAAEGELRGGSRLGSVR